MTQEEQTQQIGRLVKECTETQRELVLLERRAEIVAEALRCLAGFVGAAANRESNYHVDPTNLPQPADLLDGATVDKAVELAREIEKVRVRLRRLQAQRDEAGLK